MPIITRNQLQEIISEADWLGEMARASALLAINMMSQSDIEQYGAKLAKAKDLLEAGEYDQLDEMLERLGVPANYRSKIRAEIEAHEIGE